MMVRRGLGVLALVAVVGMTAGVARAADTYKVDPVHSTMVFRITHFNTAPFYGRFNAPTGSFALDEQGGAFEISVPAANVDTANAKRDDHLRGPDFFNAKQFANITFKSTNVKKVDDRNYEVAGDLTLHGVTKPITVKVEKTGEGKDPRGVQRAGAHAQFTIKRSDFGMDYMQGGLGDEVTLMVGLEGTRE